MLAQRNVSIVHFPNLAGAIVELMDWWVDKHYFLWYGLFLVTFAIPGMCIPFVSVSCTNAVSILRQISFDGQVTRRLGRAWQTHAIKKAATPHFSSIRSFSHRAVPNAPCGKPDYATCTWLLHPESSATWLSMTRARDDRQICVPPIACISVNVYQRSHLDVLEPRPVRLSMVEFRFYWCGLAGNSWNLGLCPTWYGIWPTLLDSCRVWSNFHFLSVLTPNCISW